MSAHANPNARLEAFCDGVFAIAITLLVIEFSVPKPETVHSAQDLWAALAHMAPAIVSFVLSFVVILITWVNHHATLKLLDKSSPSFVYANGLLLLSIAIIPFPTALLGEYLHTDYASPAVVIYDGVLMLLAVAWVLLSSAALRNHLTRDEAATAALRVGHRRGYAAIALYGALTVLALWFPHAVAVLTILTWAFWLVHGIRLRGTET